SIERVEERYALEDEMLAAITEGNYERGIAAMNQISQFPLQRYRDVHNTVLQKQMAMLTLNTLFRKSVQDAEVHPAHVDHVSHKFADRIMEATTDEEMAELGTEMVRKYCLMVRSYSLKGYSKLTREALNYIDFNLTEELSLAKLAEKLNVNKKYLSAHFKKEVGQNVTDYVNQKRIKESLKYLGITTMSVSDVALRVGIYDTNYFSRVFKKIMEMTPTEYRNMLNKKVE
ncbi:MAG: AraC family transcriptional regulator, partial [Lachnospiraceae bacterium]|nr:AraC family transcriptional regulator [Lachnospiraceae bacterium]